MLVRKTEGIYGDFVGADAGIYPNLYFFIPLFSLTTKSLLIMFTLQRQPGYSKEILAGAQLSAIILAVSRMEPASPQQSLQGSALPWQLKSVRSTSTPTQHFGTAEHLWLSISNISPVFCCPPPAG